MQNSIKGTITRALKTETGTTQAGKDWSKRSFVVTTEDKYPKEVCFTLFGEKVELLKHHEVGSNVTVHFNLSSREYNGKYYHNIDAWKIDSETATTEKSEWKSAKETSDLPF
ncbi:hypothetical protein [uncultured Mediterranean phage uvMED]|nr:hypothetical protein [uncultured Mediterranean phage uvMED]